MTGLKARTRNDGLDPPLTSFHADWVDDWAPSVKGRANRAAIAANPRLAGRPAANLARRLDLDALDASHVAPPDLHAFRVICADPRRFARLAGLAAASPVLAAVVEGEAVRALHESFKGEELKIALSCRSCVDWEDDGAVDQDQLPRVVEPNGVRILRGWAELTPPALGGRVAFLLPKSEDGERAEAPKPDVNHKHARLVRHLAERIERSQPDETPEHGW